MQKNNYVKYVVETGAIVVAGQYSVKGNMIPKDGFAIMYDIAESVDPDVSRVDTIMKTIVPRYTFAKGTWSGEEYTQPLPDGTVANWEGERHTVTDGFLTVLVDQPGRYQLTLRHPLYVKKGVTLENR